MIRGNKMILKIKLAIYATVGAILLYQNYQLDKMRNNVQILSANNAKLEIAVKSQKQIVTALETGLGKTIELSNNLAKKLASADEQRQVIVQKLNSYRGRLGNAALKKPKFIERHANNATADILRQFTAEAGSKD